jgi:hypothetical protein
MKVLKKYSDTPFLLEVLMLPVVYGIAILKILIVIPMIIIAWCNGRLDKME